MRGLFVLAGLLLFIPAFANDYQVTLYTRHQGLPQDYIYTLLQDKKNYLWIGTGNGLARFDGKTFTHYKTSKGLKEDFITSSCLTPKGERIFSHFEGHLSLFYNGVFQPYTKRPVSAASITKIVFRNNILWAGTKEGEVIAVEDNKRTIKKWSLGQYQSVEFLDTVTASASVLVASETVICEVNYNTKSPDAKITILPIPDQSGIRSVSRVSSSGWLVVTQNNTCYFLSYLNGKFEFNELSYNEIDREHAVFIQSIGNNRIWTCDNAGNWQEFKYQQGEIRQISKLTLPNAYSRLVPNNIYEDNEGNIWIGTFGSGLLKFSVRRSTFYRLDSLAETNVYNVMMTSANELLLGTGQGIMEFSRKTDKFVLIKDFKNHQGVVSICQIQKDEFLIATENASVFKWNRSQNLISKIQVPVTAQDKIKQIIRDNSNNIWFATSSGAIRYDISSQDYKVFTMEDGLAHNYVYNIFPDSKGRIWFGTHKSGLSYYDGQKIRTLQSPLNNSGLDINCFTEDNDGNVWVGTSGQGIFLLNQKLEFFKTITTKDNLISGYIYFFQMDLKGAVWVGHKNGLERVVYNSSSSVLISDYAEYLEEEELSQATYSVPAGNNIWIGGRNVCIKFEVSPEYKTPAGSYVDISDLKLNYDPIKWEERKNVNYTNEIPDHLTFKYNENLLTFTFNGISFSYNDKLRYQYKLEGFDDKWSLLTEQNFVTYNKLPPGSYTFLVKSRNYAGIWSPYPTSLSFVITPPYWETWWFRILFILFILVSVYVFIKIRTSQLKKRNQALEIEKQKLENEIKERKLVESKLVKSEISLRNTNQELNTLIYRASHDLRGPVSTISGLVNVAHIHISDKESLNFFGMINTSVARLDQILKKLFLVSEIKQNDLQPETIDCKALLESIIHSFNSEIRDKNFKISLIGSNFTFCTDKKLFETIVKNIIDNSFTYNRKTDPELIIRIKKESEGLSLSFWDNGKGIKNEHLGKIFDMFYKASDLSKGNGLGLYIAKNAVQLLKGDITVKSTENEFTQIDVLIPEYNY